MKALGLFAVLVGIGLTALVAVTTRSSGFSVNRWPDGEFTVKPWTYNANIDVDSDLRSLFREFRPGDRGDWIYSYHPWLPLSYDRVSLERGGGTLDYARGRGSYRLHLAGIAASPGIVWLLVLGLPAGLGRRRGISQP